MTINHHRQEAIQRGARMLRTALGPAIARLLADPAVVEAMLNPDGRLWMDRLSEGLSDTGERLSATDGERIVRDVLAAHILKQTGSYEQASYAIQDIPEMVAQHYGRFLPQDKAEIAARILNQVWAAA